MRRYLAFAVLFVFSLPIGLSITGCGHNPGNYCIKNGHAYGITTSQVTSIVLQPETTGVSLSWGQTYQAGPAQAYNCVGGTESVGNYIYTSSNLQLADISPAGTICAGTWNRNSEGGVPNFSICTPPSGSSLSSFSGCNGTSCGIVQVTASGGGATSNPVDVYIHPPVTSVTIPQQTACLSQGTTLAEPLLTETTVLGPGGAFLCGPKSTSPAGTYTCDDPRANIGTITYSAQTDYIVTINNTTNPTNANPVTGTPATGSNPNGVATANLPGATIINASLSNSDVTSAAGYFSTCPPAQITLSVNGSNTATVNPSSPATVVANAVDTNGATINGLSLTFTSTQPQNLSVSSSGLVTSTFPSHATVTAVCAPPGCNPAPINVVGTAGPGNGMPVAGNPVTINSPGRVSNQIWMASSQSPYFSEVDLTTGGTAAPTRLPYTPNSMVMDAAGNTLYFGSYHELMVYTAGNNTPSKVVTAVPGVVLGISPTGNMLAINDQIRDVIYLYDPQGSTATSVSGIAQRAQFSPDGTTAYITGTDPATGQNTLWVYNTATGWSTYPLTNQPTYSCQAEATGSAAVPAYNPAYDPFCGASLALTVPDVAAFMSGTSTAAHSYCPNTNATPPFYPPAGDFPISTTQLTATPDGDHILGADGTTFTDFLLYPTSARAGTPGVPVNACPAYAGPELTMNTSPLQGALPSSVTTVSPEIDQVVASPYSNLGFVTYQPCSDPGATCPAGTTPPTPPPTATGVLPYYIPASNASSPTFGNLSTLQLTTGAQAPVAGAFSPDGSLFFASTSGDDLVHEVNTGTTPGTATCTTSTGTVQAPCDSGVTINPKLTDANGVPVPAQFLAVKSRSTT
jgi:hypothetical protein